jgi:hypothetical protein
MTLGVVGVSGCEFELASPEEKEKGGELAYDFFSGWTTSRQLFVIEGQGVRFDRDEKTGKYAKVEGPMTRHSEGATAFSRTPRGTFS